MADRPALVAQMLDQAHRAWSERGGIGLLCGAPGIGKTHVASQLLQLLPRRTASLVGNAAPTGSPPLLPICHAIASCRHGRVAEELVELAEEYAGAVPVLREAVAPALRARRALRFGRALSTQVAPSETYTFVALTHLLRKLGARCPVVLFVDDIQWLDASSAAFLGYLIQSFGAFPIFVLLSARSNGHDPAPVAAIRETIVRAGGVSKVYTVPPLSVEEVREAASQLLRAPLICTDDDLQWLHDTSKGSPKYLAEVLALLRDREALALRNGSYALVQRPDRLLVPPTLAEITCARLEQLTADDGFAEAVVQFAAVCGRKFDAHVVAKVLAAAPQRVFSALGKIGRVTGYLRRIGTGPMFEFDHDLTREAVLDMLGASAADCHRTIAGVLAQDAAVPPQRIAQHLRAAGELRGAADFLARAAASALEQGAFADAVEHASACDETLGEAGVPETDPERSGATELLGRSLLAAERYDSAVAFLCRRTDVARSPRDARVLHILGRSQARLATDNAHRAAVRDLRGALELVDPRSEPALAAEIWTDLVYVYDSVGQYHESQAAYRAAYREAVRAKDPRLQARILRLSSIFWQPEKVIETIHAALDLARRSRLTYETALCMNNLGTAYLQLRDLARAREWFTESRDELKGLGGYRHDSPLNNLGLVDVAEGDVAQGLEHIEGAIARSHDADARLFMRTNRAICRALLGNAHAALTEFRELLPIADATGDLFYRDCVRQNLAQALLEAGSPAEAIEVATSCPSHHSKSDDALVTAKRASLLLRAHHALGTVSPDKRLVATAAVLDRTTKPQAWLYRLPWQLCDIEFWED